MIRVGKMKSEHDQKWAWSVCSWDSKIDSISRINQ